MPREAAFLLAISVVQNLAAKGRSIERQARSRQYTRSREKSTEKM
jgi:hypothetical protein